MPQCTLINSGGARIFMIAGKIRFSTTERAGETSTATCVLRDLAAHERIELDLAGPLWRRHVRIGFADGTAWRLGRDGSGRWRADLDDGSVTATLAMDLAHRFEVQADGRILAVGRPRTGQMVSDEQWTVDVEDDVDLPWLAAVLAALLMLL